MLLEKESLGMEEAIHILDLNNMKPSIRKLGNQKTLVSKLIDGYSLLIKEDDSKPGYLCACLNRTGSGVVITWNEINHKSLTLAIKNVQELLEIGSERKWFGERWTVTIAVGIFFLLVGTSYAIVSSRLTYCNNRQSELPSFKP